MAEARQDPESGGRTQLSAFVHDIAAARARLDEARRVGARGVEVSPLRAELLAALERYAAVITRLGAPVPPRLHAEIELYRGLHDRS